jgi:hypothetical protein
MAYESYTAYLNSIPSTSSEYYKNVQQEFMDDQFSNSINYRIIQKLDRISSTPTSIGVRIVKPFEIGTKDRIYSDDYCQIQFPKLNDTVSNGDIFVFDNYNWMVVESKAISSTFKHCLVRRCNVQLYFTASTPLTSNILNIYGIAEVKTSDVTDEQYKVLPKAQMTVQIPYNNTSKLIKYDTKRGTRFLVGNPVQAWQVVNVDSVTHVKRDVSGGVTDGFMVVRLVQTQIHPDDDLSNLVAWQLYF